MPLAITFGGLALLFQPFFKIALGRTMWNVVVAFGLVALGIVEHPLRAIGKGVKGSGKTIGKNRE